MGLPLKAVDPDLFKASEEANERINRARVADFEFLVRNIVGQSLQAYDVDVLARALAAIEQDKATLTKSALTGQLIRLGRSRDKAESLTKSILR